METIVQLFHIGDEDEYLRIVDLLSDIHHTDYHFAGSHSVSNVFDEVLSSNYDVILLDYHWQGADHARDILMSATSQGCDTPIIVMTDEMEADVDREAIGLGASDYLIKGRIDSQLIERTIRYAIERKNAEKKLARLAHFDALTNIPNRILFRDRLHHAVSLAERGGQTFTLMFLDLDGFKQINDKYGHDIGDRLLQSCANRICKCLRKSDTVARIGGDEFTVLLEHTDTTSNIVRIAKKIIRAIQRPHTIDHHEVFVGCSIGIAVYPEAGMDIDTLQKHADMAMYEAKQSEKDSFRFFTDAMNKEASQQSQLVEDLSKAVEQCNFSIHYEPIWELQSRELLSFKVCPRWQHPQAGWVEGEDLMELADEAGLSGALGYWAVNKLVERGEELGHQGGLNLILPIAIRQLYDQQFVKHIKKQNKALAKNALTLTLDIPEPVLINHFDLVQKFMREVESSQIQFALSHFGIGQFSIDWLHNLPIHQLTLTAELVEANSKKRDIPVAKAIMALALSLGKTVLVEGINTKSQWQFYRDLGCEAGAGKFFAEPMAWDKVKQNIIHFAHTKKSIQSLSAPIQ